MSSHHPLFEVGIRCEQSWDDSSLRGFHGSACQGAETANPHHQTALLQGAITPLLDSLILLLGAQHGDPGTEDHPAGAYPSH